MEQRRLRLGDILDDYCPRERRVTNHAVVAMIEEDVKQTRCTTCDAEHPYKGGKAPRRKRPETHGALYKEVLAGMPDVEGTPVLASPVVPVSDIIPASADTAVIATAVRAAESERAKVDGENNEHANDRDQDEETAPARAGAPRLAETASEAADTDTATPPPVEDGPVHRPLIRATLPRPEGQKDARPAPEFTIRQNNGRGNGNFRGNDPRMKQRPRGGHAGAPTGNGNRPQQGGQRFAGSGRGPAGRGASGPSNFRSSQQPRHGAPNKRRPR